MADEADIAQENIELEAALRAQHRKPFELAFKEGDCELCGGWWSHLVDGECTPCREDKERRARP